MDLSTPHNAAVCPSCERFIGPADVCPYCEADANKPPIIRRLRWAALFLALIGLTFLYGMARQREVPLIRIGDITPMMNFGAVRVAGTVKNNAYTKKKGEAVDFFSFYLHDGTGELQIMVSREVARGLIADGHVPQRGERVELAGTLSVSGDGKARLRALRLIVGEQEMSNIEHSTPKSQ